DRVEEEQKAVPRGRAGGVRDRVPPGRAGRPRGEAAGSGAHGGPRDHAAARHLPRGGARRLADGRMDGRGEPRVAAVRTYARMWPFLVAAVGLAGLGYAAFQWTRQEKDEADLGESVEPVVDLSPNEHYEKVRPRLVDEYAAYHGVVKAGSLIPV